MVHDRGANNETFPKKQNNRKRIWNHYMNKSTGEDDRIEIKGFFLSSMPMSEAVYRQAGETVFHWIECRRRFVIKTILCTTSGALRRKQKSISYQTSATLSCGYEGGYGNIFRIVCLKPSYVFLQFFGLGVRIIGLYLFS